MSGGSLQVATCMQFRQHDMQIVVTVALLTQILITRYFQSMFSAILSSVLLSAVVQCSNFTNLEESTYTFKPEKPMTSPIGRLFDLKRMQLQLSSAYVTGEIVSKIEKANKSDTSFVTSENAADLAHQRYGDLELGARYLLIKGKVSSLIGNQSNSSSLEGRVTWMCERATAIESVAALPRNYNGNPLAFVSSVTYGQSIELEFSFSATTIQEYRELKQGVRLAVNLPKVGAESQGAKMELSNAIAKSKGLKLVIRTKGIRTTVPDFGPFLDNAEIDTLANYLHMVSSELNESSVKPEVAKHEHSILSYDITIISNTDKGNDSIFVENFQKAVNQLMEAYEVRLWYNTTWKDKNLMVGDEELGKAIENEIHSLGTWFDEASKGSVNAGVPKSARPKIEGWIDISLDSNANANSLPFVTHTWRAYIKGIRSAVFQVWQDYVPVEQAPSIKQDFNQLISEKPGYMLAEISFQPRDFYSRVIELLIWPNPSKGRFRIFQHTMSSFGKPDRIMISVNPMELTINQ